MIGATRSGLRVTYESDDVPVVFVEEGPIPRLSVLSTLGAIVVASWALGALRDWIWPDIDDDDDYDDWW